MIYMCTIAAKDAVVGKLHFVLEAGEVDMIGMSMLR